MNHSNRKKLLILGGKPVSSCDIVKYAKSQDVYTIVTDNLDIENSPAKKIADENWRVSTADIELLEKLVLDNGVDGIFTGVHEFNIVKTMTLCEKLNLHFYCTSKQWNICSNKQRFKQLCKDNNIPVVKEYKFDHSFKQEDLAEIKYPVIVKPVDSSAGSGITICYNGNEITNAYKKALLFSKTKNVVVEEYIKGQEFSAVYTLKNGEISLSSMCDKYFNYENGNKIPMPEAFIFPSRYIYRYLEELNQKVIKMFKNEGFNNGSLFLQGIVNEEGFHFFEMGYRLSGGGAYRFIQCINGINNMEMMVNYALTGKMD
ncbi:ATP-grasp domain-containing protein, partial [uncultured Clostridium sp.]|uniref:ATP-grasp domain-containing protein n=1 Tax=uncultured Clostridium sp. TaxID=59620 RepID=UPI0028E86CCA